jgi:hypothetical protein
VRYVAAHRTRRPYLERVGEVVLQAEQHGGPADGGGGQREGLGARIDAVASPRDQARQHRLEKRVVELEH